MGDGTIEPLIEVGPRAAEIDKAAAVGAEDEIATFLALTRLVICIFCSPAAPPHLAGANNSDHPPDPKSWRGTKEKRCRVSL